MFKRKPSPEMEAINAVWAEIQAAGTERKAAMERLMGALGKQLTDGERRAFSALLSTDERRECPAVLQMRINR